MSPPYHGVGLALLYVSAGNSVPLPASLLKGHHALTANFSHAAYYIHILPLVTGLYYLYLLIVSVRRRRCLTYCPATGFQQAKITLEVLANGRRVTS